MVRYRFINVFYNRQVVCRWKPEDGDILSTILSSLLILNLVISFELALLTPSLFGQASLGGIHLRAFAPKFYLVVAGINIKGRNTLTFPEKPHPTGKLLLTVCGCNITSFHSSYSVLSGDFS